MVLFDKIGLILFHFAWQAAVIAFISASILFFLKNANPRIRYSICCISMLLMVVLPVCFVFGSLIKDPYSIEGYTIRQQVPVDTREVFDKGKLVGVQFRSSQIQTSFYEELMLSVNKYTPLISIAWMFGLLLTTSYRIYGFSKIKSLIHQSQPVADSFWETKIKELMRKTGIKQVITFLQSKGMDSPAVIGFFKPVLLIPVSFLTGIESRYIEAILLHELAHIKRYDYLVNILQLIIETFGFFHPAVWWISSQIRKERENCCDDFAVKILGDKLIYAKSLVQLEEMRISPSLISAANGSNLANRIFRILNTKTKSIISPFLNFTAASFITIFLVTSLGFVLTNSSSGKLFSNLFENVTTSELDDNLAVYFPFNGNANDESVFKQKTYTYNAALCEDRLGRKNRAFDFNGKNSHIVLDRNNVLNDAKSITISCWVYPRKTKSWEAWICKTGKYKWVTEWRMGFGENRNFEWGFTLCNLISERNMWTDYWITNTEIPLNKWTHVTVSADQDKHIVTAYTNGRKIGALKDLRQFDKAESPVLIGYQPDDNVFYDGKIDDIRIYNRVLTDQEVREVFEMD